MPYQTSLSDKAWNIISQLFVDFGYDICRKRKNSLRSIVDAIFYVVDNGTKWRNLPNDFPNWKTVYYYFSIWSSEGLWAKLNIAAVEMARVSQGREESPSLVSVDSQSQSGEPGICERSLDAAKKVNGRKRHIAVDTLGLLLLCICTPAGTHDSRTGWQLADKLNDTDFFPRLGKILGDNAYKGVGNTFEIPVSVEASERNDKDRVKGFVPEVFRWAVERTFSWLNRQRRLTRNYEKKIVHQESMNYIGSVRICLKRLEKWL